MNELKKMICVLIKVLTPQFRSQNYIDIELNDNIHLRIDNGLRNMFFIQLKNKNQFFMDVGGCWFKEVNSELIEFKNYETPGSEYKESIPFNTIFRDLEKDDALKIKLQEIILNNL